MRSYALAIASLEVARATPLSKYDVDASSMLDKLVVWKDITPMGTPSICLPAALEVFTKQTTSWKRKVEPFS